MAFMKYKRNKINRRVRLHYAIFIIGDDRNSYILWKGSWFFYEHI